MENLFWGCEPLLRFGIDSLLRDGDPFPLFPRDSLVKTLFLRLRLLNINLPFRSLHESFFSFFRLP